MAKRYMNNAKDVSIGNKVVRSVQQFDVSESAETQSGSGDGDIYLSGFDVGVTTHVVTVTTRDLSHGVVASNSIVANAAATIEDQDDATIAISVSNVKVHDVQFNTPHEGEATSVITGTASGDGLTSPLSVS